MDCDGFDTDSGADGELRKKGECAWQKAVLAKYIHGYG